MTLEQIEGLLVSEEQLRLSDYPNVSNQPGDNAELTEQAQTKKCDRCDAYFIPMSPDGLSKQQLEACRFHWGRLHNKKSGGEIIRIYTCCGGSTLSRT